MKISASPARVVSLCALTVALVIALSGCSVSPKIYARLVDGTVVFMMCDPFDATEVVVQTSKPSSLQFHEIWSAEGESSLGVGSQIATGTAPEGMTGSVSPSFDVDRVDTKVTIKGSYPDGSSTLLGAIFAAGLIGEDAWSTETAHLDKSPC